MQRSIQEGASFGKITADKLNDQRIKELNMMDMMSNSSIFNHQEIVLEM